MCVLIAKYFKDYGWVGVKNRDRNYTPHAKFFSNNNSIIFYDEKTDYAEGMNIHKTSILSASLMVRTDEKEGNKHTKRKTNDGHKITKALQEHSLEDSLNSCIESKLTGHTIVFNDTHAFSIEAVNKNHQYYYNIKEIDKSSTFARTNHGISIPWAGYQFDSIKHSKSRISSLARYYTSMYSAHTAIDPLDILTNLNYSYSDNPQLNPVRTKTEEKSMRTTSQILLIPKLFKTIFHPIEVDINVEDNIKPQFSIQLI